MRKKGGSKCWSNVRGTWLYRAGTHLYTFSVYFHNDSSNLSKKWSKKSFTLIFFPVKAEMLLFPNLVLVGPRGDLGKRFWFEILGILAFSIWNVSRRIKKRLPKSPRGPPSVRFGKINISAFTGSVFVRPVNRSLRDWLWNLRCWKVTGEILKHSSQNIWQEKKFEN